MELFLTSETTFNVDRATLKCMSQYSDECSSLIRDIKSHRIELFGVIFTIMNPKIAPPFPEGSIFRKKNMDLDCKRQIDFNKWVDANNIDRIVMVNEILLDVTNNHLAKYIYNTILTQINSALISTSEQLQRAEF